MFETFLAFGHPAVKWSLISGLDGGKRGKEMRRKKTAPGLLVGENFERTTFRKLHRHDVWIERGNKFLFKSLDFQSCFYVWSFKQLVILLKSSSGVNFMRQKFREKLWTLLETFLHVFTLNDVSSHVEGKQALNFVSCNWPQDSFSPVISNMKCIFLLVKNACLHESSSTKNPSCSLIQPHTSPDPDNMTNKEFTLNTRL